MPLGQARVEAAYTGRCGDREVSGAVAVAGEALRELGADRTVWFRAMVPTGPEEHHVLLPHERYGLAFKERRQIYPFSVDLRSGTVARDAYCPMKWVPEGRVEEGSLRFDGGRR